MPDFLPELETLTARLAVALRDSPRASDGPTVLRREPNPQGYDRSEIVTCRLADGREVRLFSKVDDDSQHSAVAYEARVYREVLEPLQLSTLRYYASLEKERTGRGWLLLEYAEGPDELDEDLDEEDAMRLAASWLGRFHAACEQRFASPPAFLKRYGADYYVDCARRVLAAPDDAAGALPWLPALCERLGDFLRPLMEARSTIVHGDFHLDNVLFRQGRVCPIDWETAGVDLGEADLVFLLDGWPEELKQACTLEYRRARWPAGAPADFELAHRAAWLCLCLYTLTGREWLGEAGYRRYLRHVRSVAEQLSLIER